MELGVGNKLVSKYLEGCIAATQSIKAWVDNGCPEDSSKPSNLLKRLHEHKKEHDPMYLLGFEVTSSAQTQQAIELVAKFISYIEEEA